MNYEFGASIRVKQRISYGLIVRVIVKNLTFLSIVSSEQIERYVHLLWICEYERKGLQGIEEIVACNAS